MITGTSPHLQEGYGYTKLSDNELFGVITRLSAGGYNDAVRKLAARGISSQSYPQLNSALLVAAAAEGNSRLVDDLIAMKTNLDCRFMGKQALHEAISGNHRQVVEQLVMAGANPRCLFLHTYPGDDPGWPIWCTIVLEGNKELVDKILRCEQVLSMIDTCKARWGGRERGLGLTAMMLAISNDYYEIVEALINAGADVNQLEERWLNQEFDYGANRRCCLLFALLKQENFQEDKITELLLRKGAKAIGLGNDWSGYSIDPMSRLRACIDKNINDDQFFFGVTGSNDKPFSLRKIAMREVARKVKPEDQSSLGIPEDLKYDLTNYKKDAVDDLIRIVCCDCDTS